MLKPYPAMKHSGVEWLGEVPAHWQVRRLRNVAGILFSNVDKHSKDDESPVRLCNYLDVYYNDRIRSDMDFMKATATADEIEQYRLVVGDVLITKDSESWDDIGVPAFVENTDHDVICGYHLALLRSIRDEIAGEYLYHALTCQGVADQLYVRANGVTRFGLSQTAIKSASLPVPSFPEQIAITRFLDHVNSRIDRYIRAKEKLIALLEEQKQAIIHQAVTGRIDVHTGRPYPAYKPSGVKWLGDVPEHWSIRRLCTLASIATGSMDTINRKNDGQYPFFVRSQTVEKIDTWSFDGEAVLTAGDGVGVGRVFHYANGKFDYHQRVYKFSDFHKISGRFFFEYFREMLRFQVMQGTAKATVDSLRLPMLRNFPFALPPPPEQVAVVDFVDKASSEIDSSVARSRCQITLLREYRTRLIADVVTGKLDVRSAATELPESMPDMNEDRVDAIQAEASFPMAEGRIVQREENR